MQISKARFAVLVAAIAASATTLGMAVGLVMGRGPGGATDVATIAGLLLLAGAVLLSGMATRPFGMSISIPYVIQSPHYIGIDLLSGDDIRRTQATYEEHVRRGSPLAVLLGVSGMCTLVVSAILNGVL